MSSSGFEHQMLKAYGKAFETDCRCQNTSWKFLRKVVNCCLLAKEGWKKRKIRFSYWRFGVRAVTQIHAHTHVYGHHENVCGQNWIFDCFKTCAPWFSIWNLFVFSTNIRTQSMQVDFDFDLRPLFRVQWNNQHWQQLSWFFFSKINMIHWNQLKFEKTK